MATLAARVSPIKGVIDRMDERLGNLGQGQRDLRTEMRSNFRWIQGITIAMWVTIMGAMIGALLAS
ncbi:MAG: hypothetical protein J4F43_01695 [Dehalococcoidia bacterium]|nr:hypothetical protein [Dehalococcoidia bacterium]